MSEQDASAYGLLSRSSLMVQNHFNMKKFQANRLLLVSYDQLTSPNYTNTFQMVIAQSNEATFLIYIYETIDESANAFVGFTQPNGFTEFPNKSMAKASNVGQRGKWIVRVDKSIEPELCPAGKMNTPFCDDGKYCNQKN